MCPAAYSDGVGIEPSAPRGKRCATVAPTDANDDAADDCKYAVADERGAGGPEAAAAAEEDVRWAGLADA